jgi:hypothetical protein
MARDPIPALRAVMTWPIAGQLLRQHALSAVKVHIQAKNEMYAAAAVIRAAEAIAAVRLDHDPRCGCRDCARENALDRALYRLERARGRRPQKLRKGSG